MGPLGPLGPLGDKGIHGFVRKTNGDYTDNNGNIVNKVELAWEENSDFVEWPLFESYTPDRV